MSTDLEGRRFGILPEIGEEDDFAAGVLRSGLVTLGEPVSKEENRLWRRVLHMMGFASNLWTR